MPAAIYGYTVQIQVATTTLGTVAAKRVSVTVGRGNETITLTGFRTQDPT